MGNSPASADNHQVHNILAKDYEQIRVDSRGAVLQHRNDQNTYLLKEYTFANEQAFQQKQQRLRIEIQKGPREYVISPVKVETQVFSSFCSTSFKLYAIFEYPQVTLKEEILARQKEDKSFEEGQLWSILQSCTNALSELSPLVSLNPYQIFISPDGHIKIIHDDLVDENYRAVLSQQMYYAPQKLKDFNRTDSEHGLRKESIFSMGMTLLQAAQLAEIMPCYNFNDCYFSESTMIDMLEFLAEKYSAEFVEILGNILEPNPNRRASLMEVQKNLDNYWSLEESHPQTERNFEESKGNTQLAQVDNESHFNPMPLNQKCMNNEVYCQKEKGRQSARKSMKQMELPEHLPVYKLQEPEVPKLPEEMVPVTPKNPPTVSEGNLFTDPKLLTMIRQDLEDINRLKHSAFYETSKYTFMYPQTENILQSIKNFQSERKPSEKTQEEEEVARESETAAEEPQRVMMKKNQRDLVFTVESYEDGRRYEGTVLEGQKQGQGKLVFQDGAYYQGNFSGDKMNGKGVLYYAPNHPAYDGEWLNDQFHGRGILYNERPQKLSIEYNFQEMSQVQDYWLRYEGEFQLDNKQGLGVLMLTNGETFEGEFVEDLVHGNGRYTCLDGSIIEGEWRENVLVQVYKP